MSDLLQSHAIIPSPLAILPQRITSTNLLQLEQTGQILLPNGLVSLVYGRVLIASLWHVQGHIYIPASSYSIRLPRAPYLPQLWSQIWLSSPSTSDSLCSQYQLEMWIDKKQVINKVLKYSRACLKQILSNSITCGIQYLHPVPTLKWPNVWPCLIQYRPLAQQYCFR